MQQEAEMGALLQGARRSLAGMPQRHLPPTEEGPEAWVLRQDWLMLDLRGRVRPRVPFALTAVDAVLVEALGDAQPVRRAVLVQTLVGDGYSGG